MSASMYKLKPLLGSSVVIPDASIMYPMKPYQLEPVKNLTPSSSAPSSPVKKQRLSSSSSSTSPSKKPASPPKAAAKAAAGPKAPDAKQAERKSRQEQRSKASPAPAVSAAFDAGKAQREQDDVLARLAALRLSFDKLKAAPPPPKPEAPLPPATPKGAVKAPLATSTPSTGAKGSGGAGLGDLVLKAPPGITYGCWLWLLLPEIRKAQPALQLRVLGHSDVVPELQGRFRLQGSDGSGKDGSLSVLWKEGLDDWELGSLKGWAVLGELLRLAGLEVGVAEQAMAVLTSPAKGVKAVETALAFQWEWVLENGGFRLGELVLALAVLSVRWEGGWKEAAFSAPVQAWLNRCLAAAGPDFARFRYQLMPAPKV